MKTNSGMMVVTTIYDALANSFAARDMHRKALESSVSELISKTLTRTESLIGLSAKLPEPHNQEASRLWQGVLEQVTHLQEDRLRQWRTVFQEGQQCWEQFCRNHGQIHALDQQIHDHSTQVDDCGRELCERLISLEPFRSITTSVAQSEFWLERAELNLQEIELGLIDRYAEYQADGVIRHLFANLSGTGRGRLSTLCRPMDRWVAKWYGAGPLYAQSQFLQSVSEPVRETIARHRRELNSQMQQLYELLDSQLEESGFAELSKRHASLNRRRTAGVEDLSSKSQSLSGLDEQLNDLASRENAFHAEMIHRIDQFVSKSDFQKIESRDISVHDRASEESIDTLRKLDAEIRQARQNCTSGQQAVQNEEQHFRTLRRVLCELHKQRFGQGRSYFTAELNVTELLSRVATEKLSWHDCWIEFRMHQRSNPSWYDENPPRWNETSNPIHQILLQSVSGASVAHLKDYARRAVLRWIDQYRIDWEQPKPSTSRNII